MGRPRDRSQPVELAVRYVPAPEGGGPRDAFAAVMPGTRRGSLPERSDELRAFTEALGNGQLVLFLDEDWIERQKARLTLLVRWAGLQRDLLDNVSERGFDELSDALEPVCSSLNDLGIELPERVGVEWPEAVQRALDLYC